jgi:hypothetical protein
MSLVNALSFLTGIIAVSVCGLTLVLVRRSRQRQGPDHRSADRLTEIRVNNKKAAQSMQWGLPVRHRYVPDDYEFPVICATCGHEILPDAYFFEIPILNGAPGAVLAICLQCDSRSPYDQLEVRGA